MATLSLVTTFRDLARRTAFRFDHHGCVYVKLDDARYQLLDVDGRPVPGMTYRLKDRGGQTDTVYLPRKAA